MRFLKKVWRFLAIYLLPGLAIGLGVAWMERYFGWKRGRGGDILVGLEIAGFIFVVVLFVLIVRQEIKEGWDDDGF